MKQFLHSYRLFLIVAALCTLSAFWLLGVRIGVEQTQRQVDVIVSYEDVCALSDASGIPVQDWLTQLADAGARELLVTPAELADPDIVRAAQDAGLGTAQAGGLAQGGTYFFAARYDTLAAAGQTGIDTDTEPLAQAQVLDALRESGSTLVLIEDRNQTGCVLPDGYSPGTPAAWSRASGSTRRSVRATRRLATAARRRSSICSTVPSWTAA